MLHGEDYVGAVRGFRVALHRSVAEVRGHFRGCTLEAALGLVWMASPSQAKEASTTWPRISH
jgi:hypothetical protein